MPKKEDNQADAKAVPKDLQAWYDRIHNAEERRKKVAEKYGWTRIKQELCGDYRKILGLMKGTAIIPINLVHAFVRTAVPSLYFRDPKLCVNPQGTQFINKAKVSEPVINYCWRDLKMKIETKKCIADALMFGHSWMKVGQTAKAGPKEPPAKPKGKKSVQAKDPQFETDQIIKDEKIWAYRVSPWDVCFNSDESVDPPYDCRWIAHRICKPLETVKEMFPGNEDLKPTHWYGVPETAKDADSKRKTNAGNTAAGVGTAGAIPMVYLYELTDMDARQIMYLVDGYYKPLADPKPFPYDFKGFQWSMLKFNPVPDDPYPYSDVYAAEPQIWEIMKLLSMALSHVKRFGRQMIVEEGKISEAEEAKFVQGIDGALIKIMPGATIPPQPIPYPPVQTDLYNIIDRLQLLFDNIVGQSSFDRGSTTATKSRTLGEVDIIQEGTQHRASEKHDIVEDFVEEIADKILSLKRQFADLPEFVPAEGLDVPQMNKMLQAPTPDLEGKMADETGFKYTKKDLDGNVGVTVAAGSMRPLDYDGRNQLLIQILRFGQALGLAPGDPASNEIGRELFHNMDMFGVANAFEEKILASGLQVDIKALQEKKNQLMAEAKAMEQKNAQMAMRGPGQPPLPPELMQQVMGGMR